MPRTTPCATRSRTASARRVTRPSSRSRPAPSCRSTSSRSARRSRWFTPGPSRRPAGCRTRCCSPSSSAWLASPCSGRRSSGSSSTPRRPRGTSARSGAPWRQRRDPARDRECGPLRRRRLSRLPVAPPGLRGDHGREAPAHPARARFDRRARGPALRAPGRPGGRPDPGPRAGDRSGATGRSRMSGLLALGVSHKTAPLALREQLALTEGRAAGVLNALVSEEPISEAAALSTCNRTELYLVATDSVEAEAAGLGVLAREAGIRPTELLGPLYSLRGAEAARHLYRVTAGLDSMIVGEAEIQGQVKRAYELALVEGAPGPILNRMFRGALAAGKRART